MAEVFSLSGSLELTEKGDILLRLDQIDKKARELTGTLDASEKKAKSFGERLSGALDRARGASQALLLGIAGLAAGITAAAYKGVQFNAFLERASIGFTTMLGSAQRAKAFLDELAQFAARTPFAFPELVTASQRLIAMGFAAEKVIPTMTAIGDAVAALGGGSDLINRVVIALGQMQARGKVAAQEMLQLTEAGIPAWEILAEKIGVDIPTAMKMVEQGAIDSATAIDALVAGMSERFGGMMEQQSRSLAGLWARLQDTLGMAGGVIFQPLFEWVRRVTERIAAWAESDEFERWTERARQAVDQFVWAVQRAIDAVVPFGQWLARHSDIVIPALVGAIGGALVPAIYGLATAFATAVRSLGLFSLAGMAVAELAFLIIRNWEPIKGFFVGLWAALTDGFRRAVASITGFIADITGKLADMAARVPFIGDDIARGLRAMSERMQQIAETSRNALSASTEAAGAMRGQLASASSQAATSLQETVDAAVAATSGLAAVSDAAGASATSVGTLKEQLNEAARERAIQDALTRLQEALRLAEAQAHAFGNEFDLGKAKLDAYKTAIVELLKAGLDPTDERVQSLVRSFQGLRAELDQMVRTPRMIANDPGWQAMAARWQGLAEHDAKVRAGIERGWQATAQRLQALADREARIRSVYAARYAEQAIYWAERSAQEFVRREQEKTRNARLAWELRYRAMVEYYRKGDRELQGLEKLQMERGRKAAAERYAAWAEYIEETGRLWGEADRKLSTYDQQAVERGRQAAAQRYQAWADYIEQTGRLWMNRDRELRGLEKLQVERGRQAWADRYAAMAEYYQAEQERINQQRTLYEETLTAITEGIRSAASTWTDIWREAGSALQSNLAKVIDAALAGQKNLTDFIKSGWQAVVDAIRAKFAEFVAWYLSQAIVKLISGNLTWLVNTVATAASAIVAYLQQAYAALVAFFWYLGPFAPAAAAGVIAAAVAGIASIGKHLIEGLLPKPDQQQVPSFAGGGVVPGREGEPRLILAHGGEVVLTPEQADQIAAALMAMPVPQFRQAASAFDRAAAVAVTGGRAESGGLGGPFVGSLTIVNPTAEPGEEYRAFERISRHLALQWGLA